MIVVMRNVVPYQIYMPGRKPELPTLKGTENYKELSIFERGN